MKGGRTNLEALYDDTGCEVAPKCLECPLSLCKYDDDAGFQRWKRQGNDRTLVATIDQENLTIEQAAERFNVTTRTVFRIKSRVGKEAATNFRKIPVNAAVSENENENGTVHAKPETEPEPEPLIMTAVEPEPPAETVPPAVTAEPPAVEPEPPAVVETTAPESSSAVEKIGNRMQILQAALAHQVDIPYGSVKYMKGVIQGLRFALRFLKEE